LKDEIDGVKFIWERDNQRKASKLNKKMMGFTEVERRLDAKFNLNEA
jgi:hypothetical protein